MKYIAAYALLVLAGKKDVTTADVEKLLKEAGVVADADHSGKLVTALKGKAFHELVAEGTKKMSSVSSSGASAAPAKGGDKKEAVKVEEKKEEEAADVDMGGLFGEEEYWVIYQNHLL